MSNSNLLLVSRKSGLILLAILFCSTQLISPCYAQTNHDQDIERKRLVRFEAQVEELRKLLKIPGMSAVIVKDQKVLWAKGFGNADLEKQIPASPDTPYPIASLTKTFAATLLMQLVEQGKLSPDEPMSKYSSEFKDDTVRVKHLLSHTSLGTPGERYRYNGDRYNYLTAVIERVTGKSFREVLVSTILQPLDMSDSVPGQNILAEKEKWSSVLGNDNLRRYEAVLQRLAKPYRIYETEIVRTPYPPGGIGAAAGLISTVLDLAKYDAAVDRHVFIKKETQERAWTPFVSNDGKNLRHGLGWFAQNYKGLKLIWHFGNWPNSFSALLLKIPEKNLSLYILANSDALSGPPFYDKTGVEGSPFACTLLRLFVFEPKLGRKLPDPTWTTDSKVFWFQIPLLQGPSNSYEYQCERDSYASIIQWLEWRRKESHRAADVDTRRFDGYVGRYSARPDSTGGFVVSKEGNRLMIELPRFGKFEMFPRSSTKFFLKAVDLDLVFVKDKAGRVTHLDFQSVNEKGKMKKVE